MHIYNLTAILGVVLLNLCAYENFPAQQHFGKF